MKPDKISGFEGAISFGTIFYGRGTDIKRPAKPLHVIVTYYKSNSIVMQQAHGRTAWQGQQGSVRIICLKDENLESIRIFKDGNMRNILTEYQLKKLYQIEFIEKLKKTKDFIFSYDIQAQKMSKSDIEILRNPKIDMN